MLLSFRVANVLSFRDEQRISFVATELNDGSARQTGIRDRGKEVSVVPVLGIYGANASGKTKRQLTNTVRCIRVIGRSAGRL